MTLRQARILSSETDNTIKQEQNTNVNIKITPQNKQQRPSTVPLYPDVQPLNQNVNFTPANPQMAFQQGGTNSDTPMMTHQEVGPSMSGVNPESAFQYQLPINSQSQLVRDSLETRPCSTRGIADIGIELEELDKKNRFLEMLVEMYENNPLKVNSYIVCESKLLMEMIKLLTGCQKVELVLNEDIGCSGCTAKSGKIIYVSKILITKDGKTEDLKYAYNVIYSQFIKYAISLKMSY